MPDVRGNHREYLARRGRLRARQVPDLADRSIVGSEGRKADRDVGHVAVGMREVGVAEKVGPLSGHGVAENPLAERRFGRACAEEVRCPPDRDASPAGLGCTQQFSRHFGSGPALDGCRGERVILGHRRAAGWAVAVHVLEADQQGTVVFRRPEDAVLHRREQRRPFRVRSVQALVDGRGALGCANRGLRVRRVRGAPVDPVGKPDRALARYGAHFAADLRQACAERTTYLPGAEHHVNLAVAHDAAPVVAARPASVPPASSALRLTPARS